MTSYWRHIIRGIGIFTVLFFFVIALTPATNAVARRLAVESNVKPAGAIVVLAAGILYDGALSDPSMRRLLKGIELYKTGFAPILVLSGRARPDRAILTEAEVRAKFSELAGIHTSAILKEETANTTREEAVRIFEILSARNVKQIILVTESLHLRRAKRVFEGTGFEVFAAPADDMASGAKSPNERVRLALRVTQETIALAYYHLAGYF